MTFPIDILVEVDTRPVEVPTNTTPYYTENFGDQPKPFDYDVFVVLAKLPEPHRPKHIIINHAAYTNIRGKLYGVLSPAHRMSELMRGYVGYGLGISVFTDSYAKEDQRFVGGNGPSYIVVPADKMIETLS